jgi:hypothetical protein
VTLCVGRCARRIESAQGSKVRSQVGNEDNGVIDAVRGEAKRAGDGITWLNWDALKLDPACRVSLIPRSEISDSDLLFERGVSLRRYIIL